MLHRVAVFLLFLIGFSSGWTSSGVPFMKICFTVATVLDFPLILWARDYVLFDKRQYARGMEPPEAWGHGIWSMGVLGPGADLYQWIWSLFVGLAISSLILTWKRKIRTKRSR